MISQKNVLYITAGVLVIVLACLLYVLHAHFGMMPSRSSEPLAPDQSILHANGMTFEIADTSAKQELGLGGRSLIPENYGMLFPFSHDTKPGFWMKDMLQPIDIIWLSDTGAIAAIDANVAVDTYPSVLYPPSPIRYVLETRAGLAASKKWTIGTVIPLPLPYGKIVSN